MLQTVCTLTKSSFPATELYQTPIGMFLYAKVVMDNLLVQYTRRDLENEIAPGVFPDGLDAA